MHNTYWAGNSHEGGRSRGVGNGMDGIIMISRRGWVTYDCSGKGPGFIISNAMQ